MVVAEYRPPVAIVHGSNPYNQLFVGHRGKLLGLGTITIASISHDCDPQFGSLFDRHFSKPAHLTDEAAQPSDVLVKRLYCMVCH